MCRATAIAEKGVHCVMKCQDDLFVFKSQLSFQEAKAMTICQSVNYKDREGKVHTSLKEH